MEARKLKTVTKEMAKVEKELEGLRTELPKAKSLAMDIQVKREAVVYKAKVGNVPAQEKLAKLNEDLDAAKVEMDDFETAIRQGEETLQALKVELTASKQEAGLELIRQCGEGQVERHTRIVKATAEIVSTQQESKQVMDKLREGLTALDFKELNLDHDLYKLVANSLANTFYWQYPRSGKFERPAAAYHRNTPLLELIKHLFEKSSNSKRQLIEDPGEGVIQADLGDGLRVVSAEENMERQARADEMKQDASRLRVGVA